MICFTSTGWITDFINGMNIITGSSFMTLLAVLILFLVIAMALSIPVEAISIIYLPLVITMTACDGSFLTMAGATLIYTGILVAKWLLPQ